MSQRVRRCADRRCANRRCANRRCAAATGLPHHRRLLDLSRASVVCDDLATLASVVRVVQGGVNPSGLRTRVVRAKNRFIDGFDTAATGGYRNVSFIVKVAWSGRGGAEESFCCELQVDLKAISTLKHELGGHKRFVRYRDLSAA